MFGYTIFHTRSMEPRVNTFNLLFRNGKETYESSTLGEQFRDLQVHKSTSLDQSRNFSTLSWQNLIRKLGVSFKDNCHNYVLEMIANSPQRGRGFFFNVSLTPLSR